MRGVVTKYLAHYLAWFKETRDKLDKQQIWVAAYQYQHRYGTGSKVNTLHIQI
jgi:hypothetical protein